MPRHSFLIAALGAMACGTGTHSTIVDQTEADGGTQVASVINVCPYFADSLVQPQRIHAHERARVSVRAVDPDTSDHLVFAWRASSGAFTPNDEPVTSYQCSALGAEQLELTATDQHGCSSTMTLAVECIAN